MKSDHRSKFSNLVEALIFFRLLPSNCLNWKIYAIIPLHFHLQPQYNIYFTTILTITKNNSNDHNDLILIYVTNVWCFTIPQLLFRYPSELISGAQGLYILFDCRVDSFKTSRMGPKCTHKAICTAPQMIPDRK